jgi:hypothetical protein
MRIRGFLRDPGKIPEVRPMEGAKAHETTREGFQKKGTIRVGDRILYWVEGK